MLEKQSSFDWPRGLVTAIAVCAVLLVAGGGYLIGRSSGEDLDAAREAGASAGEAAGAKEGAERGREEGVRAGFKRGYEAAYRTAYEDAGLDAPEEIDVPAR